MKRVVSVSIGSSTRDKSINTTILGEEYQIERIGTDGNIERAIEVIKELDGKITAFGMGGIDLYLSSGSGKRHVLRQALPIMKAAARTPIVDGTGIKNTLEKRVVKYLNNSGIIDMRNRKVLVTCAMDRFKMAEALVECECDITIGDLVFALGIPVAIRKLSTLDRIARVLVPAVSWLPFEMLYPTGDKQKKTGSGKYEKYYRNADIIAGDFHYIRKHMPENMTGKTILTNTVTSDDVELLRNRGVKMLVTTTPEWEGRSFGTNVIEAVLVSIAGKRPQEITEQEYHSLLDRLDFKPRVENLN